MHRLDIDHDDLENGRREIIAQAVASGQTIAEIYQRFGIPPATLREWKRTKEFSDLVEDYTNDQLGAARGRLLSGAIDAAEELLKFIGNSDVDDRQQLLAIDMVLSFVMGKDKVVKNSEKDKIKTQLSKGLSKETVNDIKREIMGLRPVEPN